MRANAEAEATKARAAAQAEATKLNASIAEAEKIMAIGKSTAEAYELQVKAMGGDNFTKYKITEEIGKGNIKIIPDLIVNGGNGTEGSLNGLMGLQLLEMIQKKNKDNEA